MKQNRANKQAGFTLAEVLIVLTIFLTVITITSMSFKPFLHQLEIKYFFKQLQLDIAYSQMYAMGNYKDAFIRFYPDKHRYVISPSGYNQKSLIDRTYSNNINIELKTLQTTVTLRRDGNIEKAGVMHVYYHNAAYKFVFLFGKGQTYVEKL
ncbi:MAG TPA: prepilin-type N-terminal cleavage/methylation domain-containing protein [Bacillales bacterium]|nr:prepilin-type N-terminal cleavage/methylation domain-containing protein [Bacillales bacterium]